jgi:hypothetical protein
MRMAAILVASGTDAAEMGISKLRSTPMLVMRASIHSATANNPTHKRLAMAFVNPRVDGNISRAAT